ncbi:hypothetical protein NMY22_g18417 [Coprinellus aureogranulatus]|nr:hypothetical protein NMY22_g18417 [Coprinellus aureogranulatus]
MFTTTLATTMSLLLFVPIASAIVLSNRSDSDLARKSPEFSDYQSYFKYKFLYYPDRKVGGIIVGIVFALIAAVVITLWIMHLCKKRPAAKKPVEEGQERLIPQASSVTTGSQLCSSTKPQPEV